MTLKADDRMIDWLDGQSRASVTLVHDAEIFIQFWPIVLLLATVFSGRENQHD